MKKIRIISGCYGHREGVLNVPKTEKDPPFEVDDIEAARLVSLGVAEYANKAFEPVAFVPPSVDPDVNPDDNGEIDARNADGTHLYSSDMPIKELRDAAKKLGVTIPFGSSKEDIAKLLNEASEIPSFSAENPIT